MKVTDKDLRSKYIQFQAPRLNRGSIWLGDSEQLVAAKDGTLLRPGDNYIIDIDSNRAVALELKDFIFAGDYAGDTLVVSFLEEVEDGKN